MWSVGCLLCELGGGKEKVFAISIFRLNGESFYFRGKKSMMREDIAFENTAGPIA